uniref:GP-PDE domain-containing protein n=1 Tax=Strigamia maritima TaxID=126957 RepID=T1J2N3_STRMM
MMNLNPSTQKPLNSNPNPSITAFIIMMALISIFFGYIVTSLVLFKYPNLLHRRKEMKFHCRHISHRGGAAENLENTILAFEHALKLNSDMIETDVHLTKDAQVVVSHDNNLFRVSGVNVNISDLNFNELPLLKTEIPIDFDFGKLSTGKSDRKIPLLKELFEKFPTTPINIDIKTNNDQLITEVVSNLIRQFNRESITVWGNASDTITKKCYKTNPEIPFLFSSKRVLQLLFLTYSGLLPFFPIRESCLEVFMPSIIHKLLMKKALFEHLNKRGIQTYLWVLNEEEEFERAFRLKATGVMTDYPTRLREYLDKNPQFHSRKRMENVG